MYYTTFVYEIFNFVGTRNFTIVTMLTFIRNSFSMICRETCNVGSIHFKNFFSKFEVLYGYANNNFQLPAIGRGSSRNRYCSQPRHFKIGFIISMVFEAPNPGPQDYTTST